MRVRENAESIAFYRGEAQEQQLLMRRLQRVVENNSSLIVTSRNLEFFTSFYRCSSSTAAGLTCVGGRLPPQEGRAGVCRSLILGVGEFQEVLRGPFRGPCQLWSQASP